MAITAVLTNNLTIENCYIEDTDGGITLLNCIQVNISNCYINNNENGLISDTSSEIYLSNITAIGNQQIGLGFRFSSDITISNCEMNNSQTGISVFHSSDIQIEDSSASDSIFANVVLNRVNNCSFSNFVSFLGDIGLYFYESGPCIVQHSSVLNASIDGVVIDSCTKIDIKWSNISFCFNGIKARDTTYGEFLYNDISGHRVYGIYLDVMCSHNLIHHNTFNNNQLNDPTGRLSYAWDDGYNNTFYDVDTFTGNWWSNIDSYAYFIAGYANSVDIFPLNPVETSSPNGSTEESSYTLIPFTILFVGITSIIMLRRRKE
jgi:parallel beta-helix repeat protein